jgi:hypothetical protein
MEKVDKSEPSIRIPISKEVQEPLGKKRERAKKNRTEKRLVVI